MPDTFTITIIIIIFAGLWAAFIKGRSKDRCLTDFESFTVTLIEKSGKNIWGKLNVESTGIELIYNDVHNDKKGHMETSFIVYKNEFDSIFSLICFHKYLNEKNKRCRENEIKRTYHPGILRRLFRRIRNFFSVIKDSIMDAAGLMMSRVQNRIPGGNILASQNKYVSQIQNQTIDFVATSFEPLLEKHIGKKVILEIIKDGNIQEYPGILKEYTADFIEVLDIEYSLSGDNELLKADIVIPRQNGIIRHAGE